MKLSALTLVAYALPALTYHLPTCSLENSGSTTCSALGALDARAVSCAGATKFKYFGVNEAGAEFGSAVPGTNGADYTFPSPSSIDFFVGKKFNTFRVPYMMERLNPPSQGLGNGAFAADYLNNLKTTVNYITGKGAFAILDAHNYGRFNGNIMSDPNAFKNFCYNLALQFASNANVIFDTNNEFHDMDQTLVFNLNQQCINGIRAAGAKQLILVEGNAWTGAWTWVSSGNAASLVNLVDPANNMAYEMHQYLDSDGSGTGGDCVSATIGAERIEEATNWCVSNGKKCFLGETGGVSNDKCIAALQGMLCAMQQAGGAWIGATWWAAGPWWGSYFQSMEPPSGPSIARILPEVWQAFQ